MNHDVFYEHGGIMFVKLNWFQIQNNSRTDNKINYWPFSAFFGIKFGKIINFAT
jgi:hypothetical protein